MSAIGMWKGMIFLKKHKGLTLMEIVILLIIFLSFVIGYFCYLDALSLRNI